MKTVDRPWSKTFKPFIFLFGLPFFLFGFYLYISEGNIGAMAIGSTFVVIGLGIKVVDVLINRKLHILKRDGQCYDATVVSIKPSHWIKIGSYITARIECRFQSEEGEKVITSKHFLLTAWDKADRLIPKVYCDSVNSDNYLVELFRRDTGV